MDKKAMIAMSGGVDSSVAAWLTIGEGFSCEGAIMHLLPGDFSQSIDDARQVAEILQMPFHVLNMQDTFRKKVMDYFTNCYEAGGTPNPCIVCNKELKFGCFLDAAQELGCDYVVTGHYARITKDPETGRWLLKKAENQLKDQSYFLYGLTQYQLAHSRFPLGCFTKDQIRKIAQEQGFISAHKRDSQDVCFIPDGDYTAFLRSYTGKEYPQGHFLDLNGQIIGTHKGAVCYTLGQRKGLGLAMGEPVYVCSKNMQENTVTVGPESVLFHTSLLARDANWISIDALTEPIRVTVKARSRHKEQPATVYPEENGLFRVVFDQPQRALTPGQAVVLYEGETVVGGGTIETVL